MSAPPRLVDLSELPLESLAELPAVVVWESTRSTSTTPTTPGVRCSCFAMPVKVKPFGAFPVRAFAAVDR